MTDKAVIWQPETPEDRALEIASSEALTILELIPDFMVDYYKLFNPYDSCKIWNLGPLNLMLAPGGAIREVAIQNRKNGSYPPITTHLEEHYILFAFPNTDTNDTTFKAAALHLDEALAIWQWPDSYTGLFIDSIVRSFALKSLGPITEQQAIQLVQTRLLGILDDLTEGKLKGVYVEKDKAFRFAKEFESAGGRSTRTELDMDDLREIHLPRFSSFILELHSQGDDFVSRYRIGTEFPELSHNDVTALVKLHQASSEIVKLVSGDLALGFRIISRKNDRRQHLTTYDQRRYIARDLYEDMQDNLDVGSTRRSEMGIIFYELLDTEGNHVVVPTSGTDLILAKVRMPSREEIAVMVTPSDLAVIQHSPDLVEGRAQNVLKKFIFKYGLEKLLES